MRFFWDPQQPQHALVHAVFPLHGAVAALAALLPLAAQPFYVLSRVSVQASFVPLSHPTSVLARDKTDMASRKLACSFFRSAASRALGLGAAGVAELLRLLFNAEV